MRRRVAIVGMFLESNSFAAAVPGEVFKKHLYLTGGVVADEARAAYPRLMKEAVGFYARMDALGDWEDVPILVTSGSTGGPADHGFFLETLDATVKGLRDAAPLDGLYLCNHGAMTTTEEEDGDGLFFAAMRDAVGDEVPIVATLDPHGNVSDRMLDAVDILVAYRTDPHVDHKERGAEAADLLHEIWHGMKPYKASLRLPIVPPNVSLFTESGPFAELVELGQERMSPDIANVSILGGFAFSDTSKNGLHVIVTGHSEAAPAETLCAEIADLGWKNRERFVCEAMPIEEAVERAVRTGRDPSLPATIYADLGDNCGAGGPANTLWLLEAFHGAGAEGVHIAGFCDPALVERAWREGPRARFEASFAGDDWDRNGATVFRAPVEVLSLHDARVVGRHGIVAGRTLYAGRMALLQAGPVQVSVTERRTQFNDPIFLEVLGVDIGQLRGLAIKLRATYRVAYDEFFERENMLPVDTPGRTSPMLHRLPWTRLPRPVYPLDGGFEWSAEPRIRGPRDFRPGRDQRSGTL